MKLLYRAIRLLAVVVLCLSVLIPAISYVALSVGGVQNRIARAVEAELTERLQADVSIGAVSIVPFNRVLLRDVAITEKGSPADTIAGIRRLGAGIRLMSLITDDPITVTHIELSGLDARLRRDSIGAPLNIDPIIRALSSRQQDKSPSRFDVRINTVMIRSSRFSYDVLSEPDTPGFSPHHIAIVNLRADITVPEIKPDNFSFSIRRMAFVERSGFQLESFTAAAHIDNSEISIANMALALPATSLKFDEIHLPLDGINQIQRALRSAETTVDVRPQSYLSLRDLAAFFPTFGSLNDKIEFRRFTFAGNLTRADVHVDLADGSHTTFRLSASARQLNDPELSKISIANLQFDSRGNELSRIIAALAPTAKSADTIVDRMGAISLTSAGNLNNRNFDLTASLSCEQGQADLFADGSYTTAGSFAVDAEMATIGNFNLGHLLADRQFGEADGSLSLKFSQNGRHRSGTIQADIDLFSFRGKRYHQILASADLHDALATFEAEADNNDLAFRFNGAYSLSPQNHIVRLHGALNRFVPEKLNLTDKLHGLEISGNFDIDLEGPEFHNLTGHIDLSDIVLRQSPDRTYTLSSLSIKADSARIDLKSDLADGTLRGNYDFRHIAASIRNIAATALPALIEPPKKADKHIRHGKTDDHTTPANDIAFNLTLKESDRLARFFSLPVGIIYPVEINGAISDVDREIALSVDAPYLRQGNKLIENMRLSASVSGNDGNGIIDFTLTAPTQHGPLHLALSNTANHDRINTDIAWKIMRDKAYNGHVAALADFWRDETDHSLNTGINLMRSNLTFNDSTWIINPAKIRFNGLKHISVEGINVHRSNQFVRINGTVSDDAASLLTLDLRNFNLDYLFESLGIDKVQLGGDATGTFYASHLLSGEPVIETPGLNVSNISYNKVVLGNALVHSNWQQERHAISLNAVIDQPDRLKSYVDGAIFPLNDSLDIRFNVDHVNIAFMQPYMEAFSSNLTGQASGKCRLWGNFKYIDLEGDVFADSLRTKINFTNTYYTATDSVHLRSGLIDLNGITLRDAEGNTAQLSGWVRHRFFKEPWFEIAISDAHNFLSYNESEKDNPVWFGKIYGNGGASVKGEPGRIDIAVDMATAPGSTFTFVLSDREVADEYSFLTFRDKNRLSAMLADTVKLRPDPSKRIVEHLLSLLNNSDDEPPGDYNLSLQMRVTPQARIILVMDPVGGDRIRANGSGHLRMDYGSANNDLRMYGTYTLDNGDYNFTLQDVIIKDFTIKPGSSIVFNGDPYAAQLNIEAYYALNANLSDLDDSFLQDQDLNRTNVPVHALMKVDGDIRQPEITFDLEFPTLTTDIYRKVRSIVSTDDMMNRQIIYLLALNRFYTPEYMTSTTKGNELVSVASSTISSQLSNLLGQISDNWNISPTFRSDRGDFSDVEVDVALSSRLLNNRLLFNGNFGYRDKTLNTNQFIGDFDLEYLLDREGRWRLKAYNRYNDQNYYLRTAKTTQGVGVVLKRDFDSFASFFPFLRRKKTSLPTSR